MTTVYLNDKTTGELYKHLTVLRSTLFYEWMQINGRETIEVINCETNVKEEKQVSELMDNTIFRNLYFVKRKQK